MSSSDILMPALSPTMEEGALAKWRVKPGDRVKIGDVIAEVEADKATMDVEALDDGVITEILVAAGAEGVKVNTAIARFAAGDSAGPDSMPRRGPDPASPILSPGARRVVQSLNLDPAAIQGHGRRGRITKGDALAAAEALPAASTTLVAAADADRAPPPVVAAVDVFATPLALSIAAQRGIDLSAVQGSGPHGRIIKADVEGAGPGGAPQSQPQAAPTAAAVLRQARSLEEQGIRPGSYDLIPLDGMRKTIARRMTDSFRDVPHFPLTIELEIDGLLAARTRINAMLAAQDVKVSVNDMVIKAGAVALKRVPEANASYTPEGIAMHHHADIAMAVAAPGGLITPIIFGADSKGLAQIAMEAKDLAARARNKALKPEEFQGGTFSISNLGMFGITRFTSIINEPQGAIMSVGVGERRPVVRGDQLAVATVMSVTLTCDHRVVDGATGARFLAAFKALIEDPITIIV